MVWQDFKPLLIMHFYLFVCLCCQRCLHRTAKCVQTKLILWYKYDEVGVGVCCEVEGWEFGPISNKVCRNSSNFDCVWIVSKTCLLFLKNSQKLSTFNFQIVMEKYHVWNECINFQQGIRDLLFCYNQLFLNNQVFFRITVTCWGAYSLKTIIHK